jgi:GWxTD domain-containing protein
MNRRMRVFIAFALSAGLVAGPAASAQDKQDKKDAPQSDKQKRQQTKNLYKELEGQYKDWLSKDVIYIITDDERTTFLRLSTNEEREQFIEAFWQKRNPNPDSVQNDFKEEHYRRIAYANEHFASGIPGWKTDRGRIYIIWGKPDETESHPSGGAYTRTPEEGGGETSTFPFERWRYRYLECCGTDVNLEFVDQSGSGEYRLSIDPQEKDALLLVPGAGLTDLEAQGMASKTDRVTGMNGMMGTGNSLASTPARDNSFDKIELMSKIFAPPPIVRNKDLEEMVTARIVKNQIHFDWHADFLRITSDTDLVPVTVQIPNKQLTFNDKEGVHTATMNIYGRISTLNGRTVLPFEDVITADFPNTLLQQSLAGSRIYQKSLPLRPGLYRLDLVIKDVNSGNVGVVNTALRVTRFEEDKLDASSLILADQIEKVAAQQIGLGQFVIGDSKVRPKLNGDFTTSEKLGLYLQVYNIKQGETTHKSDVAIHYSLTHDKDPQPVFQTDETSGGLGQTGDQLTIERVVALKDLAPGKYKIEIQIKDRVANQEIIRTGEFTLRPAATNPEKTAAATTPGR